MEYTEYTLMNFLSEELAAHEGGRPPIKLGYDDATFNYYMECGGISGYGRSLICAIIDYKKAKAKKYKGCSNEGDDL